MTMRPSAILAALVLALSSASAGAAPASPAAKGDDAPRAMQASSVAVDVPAADAAAPASKSAVTTGPAAPSPTVPTASTPAPGPGPGPAAAEAPAAAGEAESAEAVPEDLAKRFETRFPGAEVVAVRATGYPQLFEIQVGSDLLYTNAAVDFVMHGTLIDGVTRRDLTELRQETLAKQAFGALPLERAIKQVKGDGSRRMAIFEDPNCGYCKQLHRSLASIDNITIYTFLYPILSPDSTVKSRNIWCAKDRAAVWRDWMLDGKQPPSATCETPIEENLALGKQLLVRGTPAIFFADGSRLNGAAPAATLSEVLERQQ